MARIIWLSVPKSGNWEAVENGRLGERIDGHGEKNSGPKNQFSETFHFDFSLAGKIAPQSVCLQAGQTFGGVGRLRDTSMTTKVATVAVFHDLCRWAHTYIRNYVAR